MPIIYSLVARGSIVLAECTTMPGGNVVEVTRRLLEKLPENENSKKTYVYDRHLFHYVMEDGLLFLCVTDEEFGRRIPFAFLEDIKSRFVGTYGVDRARSAPPLAYNDAFSRVLSAQMSYYSNNKNSDKISQVKGEVDELKSIMVENIEKVLSRGDRIEHLVDKTEHLENQAIDFKKSSTALKRTMWMRNCKMTVILVIVLILVIYFAVAIFCGMAFQKCRKSSSPPAPPPPNSASPSVQASITNTVRATRSNTGTSTASTEPSPTSSSTPSLSASKANSSQDNPLPSPSPAQWPQDNIVPKIQSKLLRKRR